jgi:hypothetical protein
VADCIQAGPNGKTDENGDPNQPSDHTGLFNYLHSHPRRSRRDLPSAPRIE